MTPLICGLSGSGARMEMCPTLSDQEYSVENLTRGVTLAGRVTLAGSSAQRRRGLLGVDKLANGAGLWINPCEAVHTFGMKMDLDAVWLDGGLRVRKISARLKPGRIAVCLRASSVLELAAGASLEAATQAGDQLSFHTLGSVQESGSQADEQG